MVSDFDEFFASAMGLDPDKGRPHAYQRAIACEQKLPELVSVPTGCGKTAAVVLGWLWRRLKHPEAELRNATPRRLVYCLPMRTLVEQVRANAVRFLHRLDLLAGCVDPDGRYRPAWVPERIPVFTLMGGEEAVDWQAYPEREVVLIGTQDMLLSRALNRGYALYPAYWPMDFGQINTDSLWVFDEVQLMGVGRTTSAQLQFMTKTCSAHLKVPARRTIWMSATLGSEAEADTTGRANVPEPSWMCTPERQKRPETLLLQTLSASDISPTNGGDGALQKIVHAPKRLTRQIDGAGRWTSDSSDLFKTVLERTTGQLTLVVFNTVGRARTTYNALSEKNKTDGPEILQLHSRFRPRDRAQILKRIGSEIPSSGRVIVSTQVLEAGIDLDAHRIFTEIAPWPSLVQRFGRLNRRGFYDDAQAIVFEIPFDESKVRTAKTKAERDKVLTDSRTAAARPYDWNDIEKARKQLAGLNASLPPLDRLPSDPLPLEGPVLRAFHVKDAFDTDADLTGGHTDVSGFVRAREHDVDVYVFWRDLKHSLENQPPPHPDEICAVPICEFIRSFHGKAAFRLAFDKRRRTRAWQSLKINFGTVHVGDMLVVDVAAGGYTEEHGWLGGDPGNSGQQPDTYVSRCNNRRCWVSASAGASNVVEDIDDRILGYSGRARDPRSFARRWMTLDEHLNLAQQRGAEIVSSLVADQTKERIAKAARWHDVGKALERQHDAGNLERPFQVMLRSAGVADNGHPQEGVLYAKSNRSGGKAAGFRHEVASALAYLAQEPDPDNLVAYLIMCHHGKVRLLPEPWDEFRMDDANGVRPGDVIAEDGMAGLAAGAVNCDPARLLASANWPSWQGRVARLLKEHGPFELAYLECLLRAADWRASA